MGLLQKLLSTLGLRESSTGRGSERSEETTVTVEHEPDVSSESAVKGTDEDGTETPATAGTAGTSQETTSSESASDTGQSTSDTVGSTEPATTEDDTATEGDTVTEDTAETGEEPDIDEAPAAEAESTESAAQETTESSDEGTTETAGSDESTDVLNGIGPAYAERLGNAGVDTVADLAGADAAGLADETGLGEGRIANWIEQAKEY